jgi:hypothetical protein
VIGSAHGRTNRRVVGSDRFAALVAAVALAFGTSLAGCSLATVVKKAVSAVQANKAVIDLFSTRLESGQPTRFEVTYTATGSAPVRVVYAARSPGSVLFSAVQGGSGSPLSTARLIVNSSGAYACTRAPGAGWVCDKLPRASAVMQQKVIDLYTPEHWVAFLKGLAVMAGFAGDRITSSTMTLNGFGLQCVDLRAKGVAGTSKICTTNQHLLGYVQVASESTGFEIKSYSASPAASLFAVPPRAKIIAAKAGTK